jgi:hypothetical protein
MSAMVFRLASATEIGLLAVEQWIPGAKNIIPLSGTPDIQAFAVISSFYAAGEYFAVVAPILRKWRRRRASSAKSRREIKVVRDSISAVPLVFGKASRGMPKLAKDTLLDGPSVVPDAPKSSESILKLDRPAPRE